MRTVHTSAYQTGLTRRYFTLQDAKNAKTRASSELLHTMGCDSDIPCNTLGTAIRMLRLLLIETFEGTLVN